MGTKTLSGKKNRSSGSSDNSTSNPCLIVLGSDSLVTPPILSMGGCNDDDGAGDDMGIVLEGLPDEEDLKRQRDKNLPDAVECSFAESSMNSNNSSMNSSFCIWDKCTTTNDKDGETVDALTAVAADGRPLFYQFQDENEKSISNRSRTCFDNGDSKHSTRSSIEHSNNRSTRVRTVIIEDDVVVVQKNKKCVQFAENIDGSVQSTTCTYPKATDPELWWSSEEWTIIKKRIRKAVNHHKVHSNPKYNECIRGLMYSYRKNVTKEMTSAHMKHLVECYDARGLESYIVGHSKALTDAHLDAVLKVQEEMQRQGYGPYSDQGMEEIRKAGKKSSRPARQLALKLAETDTHQALRATLSSWKSSSSSSSSS